MRRALLTLALVLVVAAPAAASTVVRDGAARFEVITPSLVRLEYAPDGRFEDRPTQTTAGRLETRRVRVRSTVRGGERIIRTARMTLRWRRGEPFGADSLRLRAGRVIARPAPGPNPAPLGGWRRSLDLVDGPVALHEGVLSRAGWSVVDDTATALMTPAGPERRPAREAAYQDLYLFASGGDHARALRDLRTLTGPVPLLPRKAFGVWFSRWWPYSATDWEAIAARFRQERVPLDVISLDTDFKRVHDEAGAAITAAVVGAPGLPYSWNGWDWNRELYPDPPAFLRRARDLGVEVGLNIHPSISSTDPRYAETQERAGGGLTVDDGCRVVQADPNGLCMVFDWSDPEQLDAYFDLHEPFERDGIGFWWLDWCCDGSRASLPGLTPDTFINARYAQRQRERGSRWPAFSRIGGSHQAGFGERVGNGALAEHRHTLHFTGDTCASWPLLAFASEVTTAAAAVGMAYVSHDIGTFHAVSPAGVCDRQASPLVTPHANSLPPEMYVRWVQLGTFQPLDRLHSHHGRRLPWEYGGEPGRIATEFLRLRGALNPHLYALAREAHDSGLPMARALWLTWPAREEAYAHPAQYTLGRDVLVAPVAEPGDPAQVRVWFPPGTWTDWFTGERHRGPATRTLSVPLKRLPVFVRAGGVVVTQPPVPTTPAAPPRRLVLTAYRGTGRTTIYDDAGEGLAYERGAFARTAIRQSVRGRTTRLTIGRARGRGAPARRAYEVRLVGAGRPERVTVGGRRARAFAYDARTRTLTVRATGATTIVAR